MSLGFGFGFPRFPVNTGGAISGAALNLNFTSGNQALDPRITFTRGGNATVTGDNGVLQYAPHNLLTYSEQFDNVAWLKTNASVSANAMTAPDGAATADKYIPAAGTLTGSAGQAFTAISGTTYIFSVYVKKDAEGFALLQFDGDIWNGITSAERPRVWLDLNTGTISNSTRVISSGVSPATNGYYRFWMAALCTTGAATTARAALTTANNGTAYTGDGTSGLYIWGAQLNVGGLQPYYPTTVKNLLGYSQEFDNAAWVRASGAVVDANVAAAPDGSMFADKLSVGTSTFPQVTQAATTVVTTPHTGAVYFKAAGLDFVQLRVRDFSAQANFFRTILNLTDGTVTQNLAGGNGTLANVVVQNAGNGWWRVGITGVANTSGTSLQVVIILTKDANATVATPTNSAATDGVFIWGAQLSDSASLDPYVYNPGAAPSAAAYYGPRFDYDPVTLAPKGLLIEEQRTNSIRNNTMQGAVIGTPGTLPTNWQKTELSSLTIQVAGVGVEGGISYTDFRITGTASGTSSSSIQFEQNSSVSASNGQTWALSAYVKVVAGSTAGLSAVRLGWEERATGFLTIVQGSVTPQVDGLLTGARSVFTGTNTNASTTFIKPFLNFTPINNAAIDITLRIGMPQLEQGAFATSVIPTSTAAATRAADVATMTGTNFSSWYNQTEGTLFAEYEGGAGAAARRILSVNDTTTNNAIQAIASNGSGSAGNYGEITTLGVTQGTMGATSAYTAGRQTSALAYATNNVGFAKNGGSAFVDLTVSIPTVSRLEIGFSVSSAFINGHIRRIAYYPRRLVNSELQVITA